MPEVVTCGETMALIRAASGDRLRHAASLRLGMGGAESNVAIALARLGRTSGWMSRVGNDELGQLIIERVRAEGVDVSRVDLGAESTGLFLRDENVNGSRAFYYRSGSAAANLEARHLDLDYVATAQVLHLTGITPALSASCRQCVDALIDAAHAAGVTVSFDVNYRSKLWSAVEARNFVEAMLPAFDILFVGHEEAAALWPEVEDDTALIDNLAESGARDVLYKRGGGHATARIGGHDFEAPAVEVTVRDTTGAGDAFAGGYLAAKLAGQAPAECLRTAQAVGAACVTGSGDYENLPYGDELTHFLADDAGLGR